MFQYRVVVAENSSSNSITDVVEKEINALAREGFKVISTNGFSTRCTARIVWTLERKVPDSTPYRGEM